MTSDSHGTNRRAVLQLLGATGIIGTAGYVGAKQGEDDESKQANGTRENDSEYPFERIPAIDLPVIDAYYEGDVVWFLHTDVSDEEMADRLSEMVNYPTYHTPALADVIDLDAAAPIYVFTNGINRSDAEPWGGGPFGYQIDVLDTIPGDGGYTSVRNPRMVTWNDDADPEILTSVDEIRRVEDEGRLQVKETDVAVTAPVVSWPGGPDFPHMSRRSTQSGQQGEGSNEEEDSSKPDDSSASTKTKEK